MNTGRYKSMTEYDAPLLETGYVRAWASPISHFDVMQEPDLTTTTAIGEIFQINDSHQWITGKEPFSIFVKQDSIECDGESVGDIGNSRMIWKPKIVVLGDGATVTEIMENLLNEDYTLFVQDGIHPGQFIQFGCKSLPSETEKENIKSGTLLGGYKGYEWTVRSFSRYFYNGVIPVMNSIFSSLLTDDGLSLLTDDGLALGF